MRPEAPPLWRDASGTSRDLKTLSNENVCDIPSCTPQEALTRSGAKPLPATVSHNFAYAPVKQTFGGVTLIY
jgi:hypothetical protein